MATYNGEKYVAQQIESIIDQTYSNIDLYIRDDGSIDSTVSILNQYSNHYENIHVFTGEQNLGYPQCFYALIRKKIDADYYFFADQDDKWKEEKVANAIKKIEMEDDDEAVCYYGGYTICDSNLVPLAQGGKLYGKIQLVNTLFEVPGLEFTMAINKKAMELLLNNMPYKSSGRGVWMAMLYSSCGKIVYDNVSYAFYRRHNTAVTSQSMNFWGIWKWRLKQFLFHNALTSYKEIIKDIKNVYYDLLDENDKKLIDLFADEKYFPNVIKKVFFPKRLRRNMVDELGLRFLFLLGKI